MKANNILLIVFLAVILISCQKPITYQNRVAEDLNFRLGKWYSITDSIKLGTSSNTLLDTVWFISDSFAGWTGFVPHRPREFAYMTTYFPDPLHITYIIRNYQDTTKWDTIRHECGMTPSGDTFAIYWDVSRRPPWVEQYVKKKD